jgi:hypothetical protein
MENNLAAQVIDETSKTTPDITLYLLLAGLVFS